jgi:hypothetical protein
LQACQTTTGWVAGGETVVSTYSATNPTGYSGDSLQFAVTASSTDRASRYTFPTPLDLTGYGTGAIIRAQVRCASDTNLTEFMVELRHDVVTPDYWRWPIFTAGAALDTWTEVAIPVYSYGAAGAGMDWSSVIDLSIISRPSGSYTGSLQVRDIRLGQVANDKDTPTGDLVADSAYDVRARYRDDAATIASSTLAANSVAGASNIKVAAITGLVAGQDMTITSAGVPETRRIVTVGTAGAGGSGVDVAYGYTAAHTSGDALTIRTWGPWTGWATFTYAAPPVVAANLPADTATVNDPTRTLSWTFGSSKAQDHAVISIFERIGTVDELIWQETQDGTAVSWDIPPFLIGTGNTYAWEVEAFDTTGLSATTTRRSFDTSFSAPAVLADLATVADDVESAITISWTASADPYLHHYRVWWQQNDGTWLRVDGGPAALGDGRTALTTAAFSYDGGRLGDNVFRVEAHNGAQVSEPAYAADAALASARPGSWMLVAQDGSAAFPFNPRNAPRSRNILMETYRPPGRGSAINLSWGSGGRSLRVQFAYVPGEDGDISAELDRIIAGMVPVFIKPAEPYGHDPLLGTPAGVTDEPDDAGMVGVSVEFEEVEI